VGPKGTNFLQIEILYDDCTFYLQLLTKILIVTLAIMASGCGETFIIKEVPVPADAGFCTCEYSDCVDEGNANCIAVHFSNICSNEERRACIDNANEHFYRHVYQRGK